MAFFFPEWIPWWLQLTIVGVVIIFGFCFLLMPFSVFGLKSRLTYLDHQIEDIQAQLRVLLKRLPDARERLEFRLNPITNNEKEVDDANDRIGGRTANVQNHPTCFDPPLQSQEVPINNASKTNVYNDDSQRVTERKPNTQSGFVSEKEYQSRDIEERDERLYNPPAQDRKQEENRQQRRRAEPILRWPPR